MSIKLKSKTEDQPAVPASQHEVPMTTMTPEALEPQVDEGVIKQTKSKKRDPSRLPTLEFDGAVGMMLMALAEDLKSGAKTWNVDVKVDAQDMVQLRWPKACSGYGLTSKNILSEATSKDWIWVDPYAPLVRLIESEFEGESCKALRLNPEPSDAFMYHSAYDSQKMSAPRQSVATPCNDAGGNHEDQQQKTEQPVLPAPNAPMEIKIAPELKSSDTPTPSAQEVQPKKLPSTDVKQAKVKSSAVDATPRQREIDLVPHSPQGRSKAVTSTTKPAQQSKSGKSANRETQPWAMPETAHQAKRDAAPSLSKLDGLLAVLSKMDGAKGADGSIVVSRQACSVECKAAGLDLSRKDMAALVEANPERLRQKGAFIHYFARR